MELTLRTWRPSRPERIELEVGDDLDNEDLGLDQRHEPPPAYLGGPTITPMNDRHAFSVRVFHVQAEPVQIDIALEEGSWSNWSIAQADLVAGALLTGADQVFLELDGPVRRYHRTPSNWKTLYIGGKRARV